MDSVKGSRDSRGGTFRELPHFPAVPAATIRGRELAGGEFKGWLFRLAGVLASLGAYF